MAKPKSEPKPEVAKETAEPKAEREVKHEPKRISDADGMNQAGCPRLKVHLNGGREAYLTRALLKTIGNYDKEGRPLSRECEPIDRVAYFTQLLDRWEAGEFI